MPSQDEAAAAQRRREDAASARVAALRSSDMSSYISLLQQTKNKRLQEVLAQTDACLGQIAAKVAAATRGRAAQAGGSLSSCLGVFAEYQGCRVCAVTLQHVQFHVYLCHACTVSVRACTWLWPRGSSSMCQANH
jgi:hypothetical protein